MVSPQNARLLSALDAQYRELDGALARLEAAADAAMPPPSSLWRGTARGAFDAALSGLSSTVVAGCAALRSARDHTARAIDEVLARG